MEGTDEMRNNLGADSINRTYKWNWLQLVSGIEEVLKGYFWDFESGFEDAVKGMWSTEKEIVWGQEEVG